MAESILKCISRQLAKVRAITRNPRRSSSTRPLQLYPGKCNPIGLLTGKSTVFTRAVPASNATGEDVAPMIVVDFGQNIVGFLSISFGGSYNSTPGLPSIRLAFSETLEYLTDVSDFSRSYNVRFHFIFQPHIMTFLRETQSPQAVTR
jgi:hypothetical protein